MWRSEGGYRWSVAGFSPPNLGLLVLFSVAGSVPANTIAQTEVVGQGSGYIFTPVFVESAQKLGIDFHHFNGMTGRYTFPEMTGQGGAMIDFDLDGDLDLYLVQGTLLPDGSRLENAIFPPPPGIRLTDRLFRNDLQSGSENGAAPSLNFVDVTDRAGIDAPGYGMGVAVGDIDSDGWPDLYVTNYGPNQLLRNRGDGTFEDVTETSGTGDPLWGTSAAFLDFDNDGDDDLYLVNYVTFDVERNPRCFAGSSRRDYCGPTAFEPQPDRLYENRGDGRFADVTSKILIGYQPGPGLGVAAADLNGDLRVDLYVANDGSVNQMWIQQGDGTFIDDALFAGVALNAEGKPEASMGVDLADFDGDGDEDIFLTHLMGETNTLFVNDGTGLFTDRTLESGLGAISLPYTSFGTAWIDFDSDGRLDLLAANGAVRILEDQAAEGDPYPLKQPNQLFHNTDGRFVDVTPNAGGEMATPEVSRGLSVGDLDNDGAVDVVVYNNSGPPRLLLNRSRQQFDWLGVGLRGRGLTTWESGVRFELLPSGDLPNAPARWRRARADGSYCSANDPRVLFGLGGIDSTDGPRLRRLRVHRPGRPIRDYRDLPVDRFIVVAEEHDTQTDRPRTASGT